MARKTALRAALLRAASEILIRLSRRPPVEPPPPETVCDDRWEIRIEVRVKLEQTAGDGQDNNSAAQAPQLTPLDRLILEKAPAQPVTMAALARLCLHEPDSYFQTRVRRLTRAGRLVREFRGWRRA